MSETQALQVDIFGETQPLESLAGIEVPKPRDASAYKQSRLFEPQMEGQLTLEMRTPPIGGGVAMHNYREES